MMKSKYVFVIGHRIPDSDSVCSAIGYAYFKNHLDKTRLYIPCRAGKLNQETTFILERFNLEVPMQLDSAVATVEDMDIREPISISPEHSIMDAGHLIKDTNIQSIPVVNAEKRVVGIMDKIDLAVHYVERVGIEDLSAIPVNLCVLVSALKGKVLANSGKVAAISGDIFIAASQRGTIINRAKQGNIAIIGDRTDVQMDLIQAGCSVLIITGDHPVTKEVLSRAKRAKVLVISTPYRSFATAKIINLCMPVSEIMSQTIPTVVQKSSIIEVKEKVLESRYRCVLVVDDDNRLTGIITRSDLLDSIQKQIILVDHNEISQAIEGIEHADIIEIIDHHRVGDISTIRPITVYNEPIGSTCTIIAYQIFLHRIKMAPEIAGALLSGILSDTLLLTLSTSTKKDHEMASKLARVAGLGLVAYGKELLASNNTIKGKTPKEILFQDFKEYSLAGKKIGVNQIMVFDDTDLDGLEDEIKAEMDTLCKGEGYDLVAFLITNPLQRKGEEIIVVGDKHIVEKAFGVTVKGDKCFIPKILSRKKDFIPKIFGWLQSNPVGIATPFGLAMTFSCL